MTYLTICYTHNGKFTKCFLQLVANWLLFVALTIFVNEITKIQGLIEIRILKLLFWQHHAAIIEELGLTVLPFYSGILTRTRSTQLEIILASRSSVFAPFELFFSLTLRVTSNMAAGQDFWPVQHITIFYLLVSCHVLLFFCYALHIALMFRDPFTMLTRNAKAWMKIYIYIFVNKDLANETLEKRKEQVDKFKEAKRAGKTAYFTLDRLVIRTDVR